MRFLIALIFVLGLSLQVLGQTTSDTASGSFTGSATTSNTNTNTVSNTNTNTVSNTNTNTVSNTNTNTVSNSGSNSGSVTNTVTKTVTTTGTWTSTPTWSSTGSVTGSPTSTYPQGDAPINLKNECLGHIINVCPTWDDPANFVYDLYRVYFSASGSGIVSFITSNDPFTRITNLAPATVYNVWVAGIDTSIGVWSLNSTTVQMTTDPADPKKDTTRDIQNFGCIQTFNVQTQRVILSCGWSAAQDLVHQINFKVHCTSLTREPLLIRKRLYGPRATVTTIDFNINRDDATCYVKAHFFYARRPTGRKVTIVSVSA